MVRFIVLTILNFALPFLLRAAYIYFLRLRAKAHNKKNEKTVNIPAWDFPILKLFLIGLLLLLVTLVGTRLITTKQDTSFVGNQARSEDL